jgi:hypothetical protein
MKTLRVTHSGRKGFNAGAGNIIKRILCGKAPAACLAMCAQRKGFGILRVELLYDLRPQHARSSHLCYFHEMIHADGPEERKSRREIINIKS